MSEEPQPGADPEALRGADPEPRRGADLEPLRGVDAEPLRDVDAEPLRGADTVPLLVVDAANVVGSRPDGWWRDRAGATARLRDRLAPISRHGLPGLPAPVEVVLVVEGAARRVTPAGGVRVVPAERSGDDAIVGLVGTEATDRRCLVVTADRALRDRVTALGAEVRGPRWLSTPADPAPGH